MDVVSERFYNQDQSWFYERIVKRESLKLRVLIRRNTYDDQSYQRGYAFDPIHLKWNLLVDKPIVGALCYDASYVNENVSPEIFLQDAMAVLSELLAIVSGYPPIA